MKQRLTSAIRIARQKKGITQAELGLAVGVTKASVSGWELGTNFPDVPNLGRLADALQPHFDVRDYVADAASPEAGQAA